MEKQTTLAKEVYCPSTWMPKPVKTLALHVHYLMIQFFKKLVDESVSCLYISQIK